MRPAAQGRVLAAGLVLASLVGCGAGAPAVRATAGAPCVSLPAADPAALLPAGFPVLPDQVLYGPAAQGATRILFGRVGGADFLALRDDLVSRLTEAGYRIESTDQEAVEAEAFFTGPQDGTIKVQQLCDGALEVRYKLEG